MKNSKVSLRKHFWWWFVFEFIKYPEGRILNKPLKLLHIVLFPLKSIYYSMQKNDGFQWESNIWIIHGIRYSDILFKHFAVGDDESFSIVRRETNGAPIITIIKNKQNALPKM